jgi:hypothetical protein
VRVFLFLAWLPLAAQAPIPIYGTGVGATGALLSDGSVDGHYRIVSAPSLVVPQPDALVQGGGFPFPFWVANGPLSKWISPRPLVSGPPAAGLYVYRMTFDLTGFKPETSFVSGRWAADDSAVMMLNGAPVSTSTGYGSWRLYTISSGFRAGINTMDFRVTNAGTASTNNPTGLRVDISGTAEALMIPGTAFQVDESLLLDTSTSPPTLRLAKPYVETLAFLVSFMDWTPTTDEAGNLTPPPPGYVLFLSRNGQLLKRGVDYTASEGPPPLRITAAQALAFAPGDVWVGLCKTTLLELRIAHLP